MKLKDHINKLEYFCAIAEAGSLKKASELIYIGQPQLTRTVQQLEEILEVKLFVRSSRGVTLTKEGVTLFEYAQKILKSVNEAELLIKSKEQKLKGEVRIGTYDSIARYFFPEFLKYLKLSMPDIHIYLETGRSDDIFNKLKKNELDLAVILSLSKRSKNIKVKKIYTDSFGLYRSPSLMEEFRDHLIYFPFEMNDTKKAIKKFKFKESVVCDNLETVRSLTEQSMGVGLLPHRVAKEGVLAKKLVAYEDSGIKNNEFDFHDIDMCYSTNNTSEAQTYVVEEIDRFLELWYNK